MRAELSGFVAQAAILFSLLRLLGVSALGCGSLKLREKEQPLLQLKENVFSLDAPEAWWLDLQTLFTVRPSASLSLLRLPAAPGGGVEMSPHPCVTAACNMGR